MVSTTDLSNRSTAARTLTDGATPHGGTNGRCHHPGSNGSIMQPAAAPSSYQAKKQGAPAVMRREGGGGWLTANFVKLSACTVAGVVFGFAAEKAKGMKHTLHCIKSCLDTAYTAACRQFRASGHIACFCACRG